MENIFKILLYIFQFSFKVLQKSYAYAIFHRKEFSKRCKSVCPSEIFFKKKKKSFAFLYVFICVSLFPESLHTSKLDRSNPFMKGIQKYVENIFLKLMLE